jgi:hypothetical protein
VDFAEGWNRQEDLIREVPRALAEGGSSVDFKDEREGDGGRADFLGKALFHQTPAAYDGLKPISIAFPVGAPTAAGRPAIRLHTKLEFGPGSVFLVDATRMPVGDGTWPAYWTTVKGGIEGSGWPVGGEIDMMEHIQGWGMEKMVATLHTSAGCSMAGKIDPISNGGDCNAGNGNMGCQYVTGGAEGSESVPLGHAFNEKGGGVHILWWDVSTSSTPSLKLYWVPRKQVSSWPNNAHQNAELVYELLQQTRPYVEFPLGADNCASDTYFYPQTFIIDTTFCGDWAGNAYAPEGGPSGLEGCNALVAREDYGADFGTAADPDSSREFIFNAITVFSPDGTGREWSL